MSSGKKCPHYIKHGMASKKNPSQIEYFNLCGLLHGKPDNVKRAKVKNTECHELPFSIDFEYFHCPVYQGIFRSPSQKNGVVPTTTDVETGISHSPEHRGES